MKYVKPSQDANEDFVVARDQLSLADIFVVSGAFEAGMLIIGTDQPVPDELLQALGLSELREG